MCLAVEKQKGRKRWIWGAASQDEIVQCGKGDDPHPGENSVTRVMFQFWPHSTCRFDCDWRVS